MKPGILGPLWKRRFLFSPPPPPPPPAPAPAPAVDAYRYQQPQLFQTARAAEEPSRVAGGSALALGLFGPNKQFVDQHSGWDWNNIGGDWLDSNLTPQGTSPWMRIVTNAVSGGAAIASYSASCTAALQMIQTGNRWNAYNLICPGSPRLIASPFHTSQPPPRIEVTYVGGATATLNCHIVAASNDTSSSLTNSTAQNIALPVFLEFERPTAPVQSATMHFTITQHWSGSTPNTDLFIVDPPINTAPAVMGVAGSYSLDDGLSAHPSIIGVHRYVDGTSLSDFVEATSLSISSEASYDPALWGGATDLTKYPHRALGKWVNHYPANWSLVNSSYTGEGFEPLAPGVGAIRLFMPKAAGIVDGSEGFNFGSAASHAKIFLPEPIFGLQQRLFVRHYMRLGTPRGVPYRMPIAERYHVYRNGTPDWTSVGGKMGIVPDHSTSYGGVSGTSGGDKGWQMRLSWGDCTDDETGPNLGGIFGGLHTFDFLSNNPLGHRYGATDSRADSNFGTKGGMGIFYANKWYCVEMDMKLNSVMVGAPGYLEDGEIRVYIDGRLALERTGMVFRKLPIHAPAYDSMQIRPARELGHAALWLNYFHGGQTQNTVDRTMFLTGVAYGTSYIGPMSIPSAGGGSGTSWPFTLPASGSIGRVSTNTLNDTASNGNEIFSLPKVLGSWCGAAVTLVKSGATVTDIIYWIFGGGHNDTANDAVYAWSAATGTFTRRLAPSAGAVSLMASASYAPVSDVTHGENIPGRPDSQHTYQYLHGLNSDEPNGPALMQLYGSAVGGTPSKSGQAHRFNHATDTWARWADVAPISVGDVEFIIKDTLRQKFVRFPSDNGTAFYTLDYTNPNATWQVLAQSARAAGWSGTYNACGVYDPVRDLYIGGTQRGAGNNLRAISAANPTGSWTQLTFAAGGPTGVWGDTLQYRPVDDTFIMPDLSTNPPTGIWVLTPPTSSPLTNAWTWSRRAFTGASTYQNNASNSTYSYTRFQYVEALDALVVCASSSTQMECWKL